MTDRNFYAPPNTLINIDKMRREARKDEENGKACIIHMHAAYDDCSDYDTEEDHEFYGFDEEKINDGG